MAEKEATKKMVIPEAEPANRSIGPNDYVAKIRHPEYNIGDNRKRYEIILDGPTDLEPANVAKFFNTRYGMEFKDIVAKALQNLSTGPLYQAAVTDDDGKMNVSETDIHTKYQELADGFKPGQREPGKLAATKQKAAKLDTLEAKMAEAGLTKRLEDVSIEDLKKMIKAMGKK